MRPAGPALSALLLVSACTARPVPPLFDSRVPLAPLLAALKESGGDPGRVLRPRSAADLAGLESGRRYKFVVTRDGGLAVAPLPADAPLNEYIHPVLAGGEPVRTAGGVRLERDGSAILKAVVDQDSKAYCPTAASLDAALAALTGLGISADRLRVENRPPACADSSSPAASGPRYGELMAEVGRRFERLGRAFRANRLALAEFELGEIVEVFEEDLPKAEPPRESAGVNLAGVAQAFRETNLPELQSALRSKEPAAFKAAYARAAETCNGCHRTFGHSFVEVPTEPGAAVPRLDPLR